MVFCYNILSQLRHLPISPLVTRYPFCSSHTRKTLSLRKTIQSLTQSFPQTPSAGSLADDMHLSPLCLQVTPMESEKMTVMSHPNFQHAMYSRDWIPHKKLSFKKRARWEPHVAGSKQEGGFVRDVGWGLSLPISGEVSWIDLTRIWLKNFLISLFIVLYNSAPSVRPLYNCTLCKSLPSPFPPQPSKVGFGNYGKRLNVHQLMNG